MIEIPAQQEQKIILVVGFLIFKAWSANKRSKGPYSTFDLPGDNCPSRMASFTLHSLTWTPGLGRTEVGLGRGVEEKLTQQLNSAGLTTFLVATAL